MTERKARPVNGEAEEPLAVGTPEVPQAPAGEAGQAAPAGGEEVAGTAVPTVEELTAELARYKAEAEQHWQQFLHAAADLENYKKQAARAREEAVERTRRAMLAVILSVVDNIERALEYSGQSDAAASIVEGIRMTHRQVLELLANMGVRPFETVGKPFDARYHDAVEVVSASAEHPSGTVVAEVQRGYLIGDEVLRPARVRVAREG
ncbi:MAG: nucleotide exchange factor GrpE [Armatimonadota bacterium]|nr:nucleotide exchange factor GrpE [Armatimonadota bacterium]MDR7463804.1 nucleotide exchange factor GrpE [Armatimonadota bacterium]MDR7469451.1 nucleotide exchange factor GrpE [Armatimonadota bacterium]MDR7473843.1 nucleotide exchange factor GrpE [Armatimonadota bacterium]MDR7539098.1 nucleotide exchange factor GrpE [Armatimonadota bacterium]